MSWEDDAVAPCQHHGAVYAEFETLLNSAAVNLVSDTFVDGATIVQVQITNTETCCVVVNAACLTGSGWAPTDLEIERPLGTIRTQQEDSVLINQVELMHHAAWEVLAPGTYTYYLVNRSGFVMGINAAWIKAIASYCKG